jgi:hypothetical protein
MTAPVRQTEDGFYTALNTGTANLMGKPGVVRRVIVNTSDATHTGIVIDSVGTTANAGNTILTIGTAVAAGTMYTLDWRCAAGISVVCGGTNTLNVSFDDVTE